MNLSNGRTVRYVATLLIASVLAVSSLHAAESSPASGVTKEKYRELAWGMRACMKRNIPGDEGAIDIE